MTELPIACTLSADGLAARLELIDELASDGLLRRISTDAGLRVHLRDTPEVEERTHRLIAAEAQCCAFLTFDLGREGDALVLDVTGPPDARPVIDLFFQPRAA